MSEEKDKSLKDYVDSAKDSIEKKADDLYNKPIKRTNGQETHTLGIISFIMAIIGIFTSVLFPLAIQIIGIILGHVASSDIKANPGRYSGAGLVTAGLVINYILLIFSLFALFALILGLGSLFLSQ